MNKSLKVCLIVSAVIILLLPLGLLLGSVSLLIGDVWQSFFMPKDSLEHFIVCETRLPALITSILAGAALSSAGSMMQTSFSNPLAGPSIMGISTGSSLGVALVMMLFGGIAGALGRFAIIGGAFIGASAVLFILLFFSSVVRSSDALLIIGILIGYLSSSAISILNYFSVSESVHSFVLWGLGTFNNVDSDSLPLFALFCLILLFVSLLYAKSLNVLLFGTAYAESAGMSVKKARSGILRCRGPYRSCHSILWSYRIYRADSTSCIKNAHRDIQSSQAYAGEYACRCAYRACLSDDFGGTDIFLWRYASGECYNPCFRGAGDSVCYS